MNTFEKDSVSHMLLEILKLLSVKTVLVVLSLTCLAETKHLDDPLLSPEQVGISENRLHRLDNVLEAYVHDKKLAGGVLMIKRQARTVYHKAFGWRDKESGAVMQKDTLFRIASQTKAITSVGVMIL